MSSPNPFFEYRSPEPHAIPHERGPRLGQRLQAAGLVAAFQTVLALFALEGIRRSNVPLPIGPVFFAAVVAAAGAGSALARELRLPIRTLRPPIIGATAGFLAFALLARYVYPGAFVMFTAAFIGSLLGALVATYWPSE
jgi:hypothetical protein